MTKDQDSDSLLYSHCHNFISVVTAVFCFVFLVSFLFFFFKEIFSFNLALRSCSVAMARNTRSYVLKYDWGGAMIDIVLKCRMTQSSYMHKNEKKTVTRY